MEARYLTDPNTGERVLAFAGLPTDEQSDTVAAGIPVPLVDLLYVEEVDYTPCPCCGGVSALLGTLGRRAWHRCTACGWTHSEDLGAAQGTHQNGAAWPTSTR